MNDRNSPAASALRWFVGWIGLRLMLYGERIEMLGGRSFAAARRTKSSSRSEVPATTSPVLPHR